MTPTGGGPPRADRRVPTATYRLQVQAAFGFDDVAALAGYLADLGVSHAYLSPVLQAAPGSTHGYDVLDHTRLSDEAGGRDGFDAMVAALHERGLGIVVDVVPNHMTVPEPEHLNAPLWSLLREGTSSPYASWFDVDWDAAGDRVVVPVLGGTLEEGLAGGEITLAADGGPGRDETVVRYYDHELPVRPGTEDLPLTELVDRQWWRLESWRAAASTLNYRRFFDVGSLAAVRVEDPAVFDATHRLLTDLIREGSVDGLRIDHPDGLADPRGYLRRLAAATDDAWVVVEKILEGDERLPADWPCAGTTGYDLLWRIGALFVDPAGEEPLTDLLALVSGARLTLDEVVTASKQFVVASTLVPEVLRLARRAEEVLAAPSSPVRPAADSVERALVALLVGMDRYRAYVVPGEGVTPEAQRVVDAAVGRAREHLDVEDHATLDVVRDLVLGRVSPAVRAEAGPAVDDLVVRFQQTCGPVMAKGIEDTAFYRWHRLVGLNEVGGDPDHFAVTPDELDDFVQRLAAEWPLTMTTLSTHDTKRSEDVRARLAVLSERPAEWHDWLREAQETARPYRSDRLDGATEYLIWQTLVGAWPLDEERLQDVCHQGRAGGQAPHRVVRPGRGVRGGRRGLRERCPGRRRPACARGVLGHRDRRAHAGDHARPEAAPAGAAGCPRRLPGRRDRRPVPRRPGQPAAGRLRRPRGTTDPPRRGCGPRRPRRREAPRHEPDPAPPPRPPGVVHRRHRDRRPGAFGRRPRLRRRTRRLQR